MRDGQGFAELVTLANIEEYRTMLRTPEEAVRTPTRRKSTTGASGSAHFQGKKLRFANPFTPYRQKTRTPPVRTRKQNRTTSSEELMDLLWTSKPLTRRDLNIPAGANTNQTGSINLDKGLLDPSIDHRRYFRDTVFSRCDWSERRGRVVDETCASFRLKIEDEDIGEFNMAIRHTTSTDTRSYKQGNAMTRLSWGDASPHVKKTSLIGKTLYLYRSAADPKRFLIEIKDRIPQS